MQKYKQEFIRFLIEKQALKFGEFTLKSGRKSPYFINTGCFDDGASISRLGYFYASRIREGLGKDIKDFNILFGPAYKGIPLALTTAISLSNDFNINKNYTFDRKEVKDYADKSALVGRKIASGDKILMLDDVFTTGQTKVDTVNKIKAVAKVEFVGVLIAVDRQELGNDGKSAIKEFTKEFSIPVFSIVSVREITSYLCKKQIKGKIYIEDEMKEKIEEYLDKYGVKERAR